MIIINPQLLELDLQLDDAISYKMLLTNVAAKKKADKLKALIGNKICNRFPDYKNEIQVIAHQNGVEVKPDLCCEEFEEELKEVIDIVNNQ